MDGDLDVNAGSGDVAVGAVRGRTRVRTGSGDITVAATGGPMDVKAGSGDVRSAASTATSAPTPVPATSA